MFKKANVARLLFAVSFLTVASSQSDVIADETSKPNFVFILVDDLGQRDLGCYGSTFHETPRIDALAASATMFTDAYAASPVCSPTRASILTGKYPTRVGITRATPQQSLALDEVTIAEALKEGGYRTAHLGKWHLQGHSDEGNSYFPEKQGFDVNIGGHSQGQPASYFYPLQGDAKEVRIKECARTRRWQGSEFLTDRLTMKRSSS